MNTNRFTLLFEVILLFIALQIPHFSPQKIVLETKEEVSVAIQCTSKINDQYGLPVDSFIIEKEIIRPNRYLGALLNDYGISYDRIEKLVKRATAVFDVRKFRSGNPIFFFKSKDTTQLLHYFVYEHTPTNYVIFDLNNLEVEYKEKEIITTTSEGKGVIEYSLWNTMINNNLDPLLANKLSDIYAWSFDFFGLQKGDRFKILYEQQFVDTQQVGTGKILAAYFENNGRAIYAIPFTQDSTQSYYDQDGNSLKKAFLKAPLQYARITSGFSYARLHPIFKTYRPHLGVDYGAPAGTPVLSIGDGTVVYAGYDDAAGYMLKIRHNGVYTTGYLHLSGFAEGVTMGSKITQGQTIGYVGNTGHSTGPHLDFRVWMNGQAVNPLTIDAPPVEPIHQENREEFEKVKHQYTQRLDMILFNQEYAIR